MMPKRLLSSRWLPVLGLLSLAVLLIACTPDHPQSTFEAAGPVAKNQLNLFWILFWASLGIFIVVVGALLFTIFRFREKPGTKLPVQTHGNRKLEIAWTIAPSLLLIALAVMTVQTLFELESPSESNPVQVEVIAHQWWFEFVYPEYGVTTANEVHVPVGRDVAFKVDSVDVIHSFWVPKLSGKMDIIPNVTNNTWFHASEPGLYYGQCAEFCGIAHAFMKFRVIAQPEEEWMQWLGSQQAPARFPTEGLAAEGSLVFNTKGCITCHTVAGSDSPAMRDSRTASFLDGQNLIHAPNLAHFGSRGSFAGSLLENTDENLAAWLRDPEEVKPGNRMARLADAFNDPDMALTESDIEALVAYLQSLE
jgi:cytochrome c oxidase subunit 2